MSHKAIKGDKPPIEIVSVKDSETSIEVHFEIPGADSRQMIVAAISATLASLDNFMKAGIITPEIVASFASSTLFNLVRIAKECGISAEEVKTGTEQAMEQAILLSSARGKEN